jgi:nitrate/TMAO reductase-like tetraheme cytochrome c subunit
MTLRHGKVIDVSALTAPPMSLSARQEHASKAERGFRKCRRARPSWLGRALKWSLAGTLLTVIATTALALNLGPNFAAAANGESGETNETSSEAGNNASKAASEEQAPDVKLHAGSQAPYVHNINLYTADGTVIDPGSSDAPYSPVATCGKCHDTDAIDHGWHHNMADPKFTDDGRVGEPYFWVNAQTRTQLPVSERDWLGTYSLEPLGISAWDFTIRFGGRTPGGGLGDTFKDQGAQDEQARWNLTGPLQSDCLSCHLQDTNYDFTAWKDAIDKHNFKWAPSAAAPFATVEGAMTDVPDDYNPMMAGFGSDNPMPKVQYNERWFNGKRVLLGTKLTNDIPNRNCYQCHSKRPVGPNALPRWHRQQDVHMAKGMSCVDCHRNAIEHMTTRNFEQDPALEATAVKTLSCKGCHLGDGHGHGEGITAGGRMAAPRPEHKGIPPLHFKEMSCTSCHSGPNPGKTTQRLHTSLAHKLGLSSEHRSHLSLPHVVAPVFLDNEAGKLAPHRAVWPAFWGVDQSTDQTEDSPEAGAPSQQRITPLPVQQAAEVLAEVLPEPKHEGLWHAVSRETIAAGLKRLAEADFGDKTKDGQVVYVSGGQVYRLAASPNEQAQGAGEASGDGDDSGESPDSPELVIETDRVAAEAYAWPIAHDVRPAAQSIGVNGCKVCHSSGAAVDFSMTAAANWAQTKGDAPTLPQKDMHTMRDQSPTMRHIWNLLFQGRTLFKVMAIVSTLLLAGVILAYAGSGLRSALAAARRDD